MPFASSSKIRTEARLPAATCSGRAWYGCSSCCEGAPMSLALSRRAIGLTILGLLCVATTAAAQAPPTSDAVFDDTSLHEIRLTMNSRDWEALKANFQLNDYYPT